MTIGVGFKCDDGIVLATDSQYTTGGLIKTHGPKLFIVAERPDLSVLIAGAGSVSFMKMAVRMIEARVKQMPEGSATLSGVVGEIENILLNVFTKHIYIYPAAPESQPVFNLLIGVWISNEGLHLFQSDLTSVTSVSEYSCIGLGIYVSEFALGLMHRSDIGIEEAKFLAAYCIKAAKDYVDDCGKDTKIYVLSKQGAISRVGLGEIKDTDEYIENLSDSLRYLPMGLEIDDDSDLDSLVGLFRQAIVDFRDKQRKRKESIRAAKEKRLAKAAEKATPKSGS